MTLFLTTTSGDISVVMPEKEGDDIVRINVSNPEVQAIVDQQRREIEILKSQIADANRKLESRTA